jgi:hypothetical protein
MNTRLIKCLCSDNERSQIAYVSFKDSQGAETAVLLSVLSLMSTYIMLVYVWCLRLCDMKLLNYQKFTLFFLFLNDLMIEDCLNKNLICGEHNAHVSCLRAMAYRAIICASFNKI